MMQEKKDTNPKPAEKDKKQLSETISNAHGSATARCG
jgi:hypothetical protein